MIGVDTFASVFGGAPAHTETRYVEHLRAVIRAGYSPVLCRPGTTDVACILSPTQQKRTGQHPCGRNHVLDDPARVGTVVKRFLDIHGGLNVGLHLGRSRLAVYVSWAAPGMTVDGPGRLGYWWVTLPEGKEFALLQPSASTWAFVSGDHHVLVPPARLPGGPFRLVGGTTTAPDWMLR